jgi:hypothetical protein
MTKSTSPAPVAGRCCGAIDDGATGAGGRLRGAVVPGADAGGVVGSGELTTVDPTVGGGVGMIVVLLATGAVVVVVWWRTRSS